MNRKSFFVSIALAFLFTLSHSSVMELVAQISPDANPGSSVRTREDLETLLEFYAQVLLSPAYSDRVKESTRTKADRIRDRLANGDFKLGDGVVLFVQGEPNQPDTISVEAGPLINLPLFGEISLAGVLRSEVGDRITEVLTQFIRNPVVRAEGLMRLSVLGAVGQPGFYVVPADMLLTETLMAAGGPAPNANLDELRIERGTELVMGGEELQEAMRQGLTLDQLNLQAGDQVVLPERGGGFFSNIGLIVGLVSSVTIIIIQLSR